jgi:lipid A 3-O-deacylase
MPSRRTPTLSTLLLAAAALSGTSTAHSAPIDSASIETGSGPSVRMLRVGVQSNWEGRRWFEGNGRHLAGYWDLTLARSRGTAFNDVAGARQFITDVGLTPVLRYAADDGRGWYAEGGIGVHLLSHVYNNDGKRLSTAFQFGDHVGAGYVFTNGWDLGLKLQHFSNAGIKEPNSGVNYVLLKLAMPF